VLKKTKFNKSTLGGCVIEKKDNFILISKEQRIKNKKNTFSTRKMTFF